MTLKFLLLFSIYWISIYAVDCSTNNGYCPQSCSNSICTCSTGFTQVGSNCVFTPCITNPRDCITINSVAEADAGLRSDQPNDCFTSFAGIRPLGEINPLRTPILRWNIRQFMYNPIASAIFSFYVMNSTSGAQMYLTNFGNGVPSWGDNSMRCWNDLVSIGAYPWSNSFAAFTTPFAPYMAWMPMSLDVVGRGQNLLQYGNQVFQFGVTSNATNSNPFIALKEQSQNFQPISVYLPPLVQYGTNFDNGVTDWLASTFWTLAGGSPFGGLGWFCPTEESKRTFFTLRGFQCLEMTFVSSFDIRSRDLPAISAEFSNIERIIPTGWMLDR